MDHTEEELDEDLKALIPRYIANRSLELPQLKEAIEKKDYRSICTIGHRLAGAAGTFNLHALSLMGKKLEEAAMSKQDNLIVEFTHDLEAEIIKCKEKFPLES